MSAGLRILAISCVNPVISIVVGQPTDAISEPRRESLLPHYQQKLKDLGRRRVLLPRTEVVHLDRPGPARIEQISENLISRRTGNRMIGLELHLADRFGERVGNRHRLPRVPGPGSRRQRHLERIATRERQLAPIVSRETVCRDSSL